MKKIIVLFLIFSAFSLKAQNWDGFYELRLHFNEPNIQYDFKECTIDITSGKGTVKMDIVMTNPKESKTNTASIKGSATGTVSGAKFSATGSVTLATFENKKQTETWAGTITFTGNFFMQGSNQMVRGQIIMVEEGEKVYGNFEAKETGSVKIKITNSKKGQLLSKGTSTWKDAKTGDIAKVEDKINSLDARVELELSDGSVFKMKSNTKVTVKKQGIYIEEGELWYVPRSNSLPFTVSGPNFTSKYTGPEFIVNVGSGGESMINVLSGTMKVKPSTGSELSVAGGKSLTVSSSGSAGTPEAIEISAVKEKFNKSDEPSTASSSFSFDNKFTLISVGVGLFIIIAVMALWIAFRKPKKFQGSNIYNPSAYSNTHNPPVTPPISPIQNQYPPVAPPVQNPPQAYTPPVPPTTPVVETNQIPFCPDCGTKIKPNARFCHSCGKTIC